MSGDIKKRLLQVLEQNHKITSKTLATMFEITETEVKEIIKELEEAKVILGLCNIDRLGENE
jgi:DNA-binding Lrp family transcriptional regulator